MARKKSTLSTTVMTDEPLTGSKAKPTRIISTSGLTSANTSSNTSSKSSSNGSYKYGAGTHPDHHIHVMYMIMTSFLISLVVGMTVWFILDTRLATVERTLQFYQAAFISQ